jgi:beta-glucosidase
MKIKEILSQLTLEEKASLCEGLNFWMTHSYVDKGVPSLFMADGPHGLRKQDVEKSDHMGLNESETSVCYPTGATVACSWDRELLEMMGDCLGQQALQAGVDILLGPAINIKRSPLCGRNFEYYSEDPLLSGELAAAFVQGVQKNGVAACLKHFCANNQETRRKSVNSIVDERTLREIYLLSFEIPVLKGGALAVMSAYNKVNGVYPAEHHWLGQRVLRGEWGFNGVYLTDWGAMDEIVPSIRAGLGLQMPGNGGYTTKKIIEAVRGGELSESELDEVVAYLLYVINKLHELRSTAAGEGHKADLEQYHNLARKIASESMVLLKNEEGILPLRASANIAVIGEMAAVPRYQGSGSSHVNPYKLTSPLEEMRKVAPGIKYAPGYTEEGTSEALLAEAVEVARQGDTVVVFVGLPSAYESEAYDRTHMQMPEYHNALVEQIAQVNSNVVVVLMNGSPVEMPWVAKVRGILEAYLGGEATGSAITEILFGKVNPSGKLAETFPRKLEDNPSYLNFPGELDRVEYREGVFVGYRYYEKKRISPLFAFGHGLSYTTFEYSDLRLDRTEINDTDFLGVSFRVKNTGNLPGKEIVQLYVASQAGQVIRPEKELKEFAKIHLEPGEEKTVRFELGKRAFAYFDVELEDWHVLSGVYTICVGAASNDIRLTEQVKVISTTSIKRRISRNTLLKDIMAEPILKEVMQPVLEGIKEHLPFNLGKMDIRRDRLAQALLDNMTLNSLAAYVGEPLSDEVLRETIDKMNQLQFQ